VFVKELQALALDVELIEDKEVLRAEPVLDPMFSLP
jgi:hypothetical protein